MPRRAKGAGDPLKLLHLLWSPGTKMGRSGTTLADVVDAGIALSDGEGLDALTMRHLADRVGIGVMTIYGYVPGRPELIELMLDKVVSQTYDGHPKPADSPTWQKALRHIAHRNYEHALTHGWAMEVPPSRPILGPGHLTKYEDELTPLDGIGLSDQQMDQTLTHALALAHQAARWQTSLTRIRAASSLTDDQWWHTVGPALTGLLGETQLPISSRVGQSVADAGDPQRFWERGIETLIRDVETLIQG